jgi:hypothetical protein
MELSFNVAWGPISQIALPLIDLHSAVQLAVGAFGWWKARERTAGLIETINASGGHLAPCLAFNSTLYFAARKHNEFRATAWYDGRLESVNLPKASTGTHGIAGILCLRAITTVLLALYDIDFVTTILTYIIPQHLVNYNLEGDSIPTDGSFQACVREFVTSIGAEEQCSSLRNDLHHRVDEEHYKMFSTARENISSQITFHVDLPTTLGFLQWVLSPPSKRNMNYYTTRSLTAWSLSVMLSYVGFEIKAAPVLILSQDIYNREISSDVHHVQSHVFLVTFNGASTDYLSPCLPESGNPTVFSHTPRIVPIDAIPMVIFRDIYDENQGRTVDVKRLCNVWQESFENAYSAIDSIQIDTTRTTTESNDESKSDDTPFVVSLLGLQRLQAPRHTGKVPPPPLANCGALYNIVSSQLARHLSEYSWTEVSFQAAYAALAQEPYGWQTNHRQSNDERLFSTYSSVEINSRVFGTNLEEWHIFIAIILSTAYAACCKSLCTGLISATQAGLIEVAVQPTLLFSERRQTLSPWIFTLQRLISRGISNPLTVREWHAAVISMCTGTPFETLKQWTTNNSDICLGCYRNGIFIAMDVLLNPTIQKQSAIQFHIQFGIPLQIPVDEEGFVVAENVLTYSTPYHEVELSDLPTTTTLQSQNSDTQFRIDLEPCWERHPRRVIFRARVKGSVVCSFSPQYLIFPLLGHRRGVTFLHMADGSECGKDAKEILATSSESWSVMDMSQFIRSHFNEFDKYRPTNGLHGWDSTDGLLCIRAGGNVGAQILCMTTAYTCSSNVMRVIFATKCLHCALKLRCVESSVEQNTRYLLIDAL